MHDWRFYMNSYQHIISVAGPKELARGLALWEPGRNWRERRGKNSARVVAWWSHTSLTSLVSQDGQKWQYRPPFPSAEGSRASLLVVVEEEPRARRAARAGEAERAAADDERDRPALEAHQGPSRPEE